MYVCRSDATSTDTQYINLICGLLPEPLRELLQLLVRVRPRLPARHLPRQLRPQLARRLQIQPGVRVNPSEELCPANHSIGVKTQPSENDRLSSGRVHLDTPEADDSSSRRKHSASSRLCARMTSEKYGRSTLCPCTGMCSVWPGWCLGR